MTEMYYDMLLGHIGLYDEGKKLHSMKEVADFIHTHDCGYIAEADGKVDNSLYHIFVNSIVWIYFVVVSQTEEVHCHKRRTFSVSYVV